MLLRSKGPELSRDDYAVYRHVSVGVYYTGNCGSTAARHLHVLRVLFQVVGDGVESNWLLVHIAW